MKLKQIRVDGYKNLIDCVVDLGDFNVLVGPNNSGKSNLLEALQMLGALCFGTEKLRNIIFEGSAVPPRYSTWICHLEKHFEKPITIGVCFELVIENENWKVDYEVEIKSGNEESKDRGFRRETLKAKVASRRGPITTYIEREAKTFQILDRKERSIALNNSTLNAISSLYPDFKGLPKEMSVIADVLKLLSSYPVFTMWPEGLRASLDDDEELKGLHISSFNPVKVIDDIRENSPKTFEVFKESVCDILDLDDIMLYAETLGTKERESSESNGKRVRYCTANRRGSKPAEISEFSDGTFAVIGAVAAFLGCLESWIPIFCLEEPENCLHPSALEKLLRFFQDNCDRWPVLLTTHSPYLLNGVRPEDVRVAVVDDDGATHFESVKNNRELRDYLNKGLMSFGELLVDNFDQFRE